MSHEEDCLLAGARIKALRGEMSQAEFCARLGVDRKTVSGWEAGKRLPDGDSLLKLMREFSADVNYILTGTKAEDRPALRKDLQELVELYEAAPLEGKAAAIGALTASKLQKESIKAGVKNSLFSFAIGQMGKK